MSFRLYESAWVRVDGVEEPLQVHKDKQNAAVFVVGNHRYDIDARPVPSGNLAPSIRSLLTLQAMREAGLHSGYNRDI